MYNMLMKKQTKTPTLLATARARAVAVIIVGIFILTGIGVGAYAAYYQRDNLSVDQSRELIVLAVRAVKKNAPVDARTGDVYFPESRLYLPAPDIPQSITYLQDDGDIADSQGALSISTYPVRTTE